MAFPFFFPFPFILFECTAWQVGFTPCIGRAVSLLGQQGSAPDLLRLSLDWHFLSKSSLNHPILNDNSSLPVSLLSLSSCSQGLGLMPATQQTPEARTNACVFKLHTSRKPQEMVLQIKWKDNSTFIKLPSSSPVHSPLDLHGDLTTVCSFIHSTQIPWNTDECSPKMSKL